jgi:hypothetical protein
MLNQVPPNVTVYWVTLVLRIDEVPGSNLGAATGHHNCGFLRYCIRAPSKGRGSTSN